MKTILHLCADTGSDTKPSLAFMHKSHKGFIREWDCFNVDSDMEFRSLCSQGFAEAFYKANK